MGQLEKYGLYVMCLVIFLILGVTLWGEPATSRSPAARENAAIQAGMTGAVNTRAVRRRASMDDLLSANRDRPARADRHRTEKLKSLLGEDAESAAKAKPALAVSEAKKVAEAPAEKPANDKPAKKSYRQPVAQARTYTVKDGDELGTIALRHLGKSSRWPLIVAANPNIDDPDRLQVGMKLRLPDVAVEKQTSSRNKAVATGAYRAYKVRKGDSFEKISRKFFGSTTRVSELRAMNPNVRDEYMRIGKEIKIPLK